MSHNLLQRVSTRQLKACLAIALSLPLLWVALGIWREAQQPTSGFGPDPAEGLLHFLGSTAIIILLCAFSLSPVKRRLALPALGPARRMLGLFAFAYVTLHFVTYGWLYIEASFSLLLEDVVERPYITAGMMAVAGLLPMAMTSTAAWRRRLRRNWQRLHSAIYVVVPLAILHLAWLRKDGFGEVFVYALWFLIMLLERWWWRRQKAGAN